MTDVTEDRDQVSVELSAADEQLLRELTERARAGGLKLTGEGGLLGRLTKVVIEGALEGEMDDHLGYAKHDPEGRNGGNSRNGYRGKTLITEAGPVDISVPRDWESSFEPKIGDRGAVHDLAGAGQVPLLLAISDNGPQMRSVTTREFLAGAAIAQQSGRPHTPHGQARIKTLFGHVKGGWPHPEKTRDPGELDLEPDRARAGYNTVRLHAAIGYVTPDDEHEGRGEAIRQARRAGIARARLNRIAYRRSTTIEENQ